MTTKTPINPNIFHPAITEQSIARLVRTFYDRARADEVIGPIFNAAVADWEEHIEKISLFWGGIMLRTGKYHGRPMHPHLMLGLEPQHFDRWLALFEKTTHELFPDEVAEAFVLRARRIADSFELAIGAQNGEIRAPRHSR